MPSVRGWQRVRVVAALAASSCASAALVGFVAGAGWAAAGFRSNQSPRVFVAIVLGAVVLDAARVPPVAIHRQVPQLWGRIFSPPVAAALYGARLGVGPLTILTTWLWWAALLIGASAGVVESVVVGLVFAAARVVVTVAAGTRAARLRRTGRIAAAGAALLAVAAAAVAAPPGRPTPNSVASPVSGPVGATKLGAGAVAAPAPAEVADEDRPAGGLAGVLPMDLGAGFERLADDGRRLGALDLAEAAAVEPDSSAERALLETRRFRVGHARAWRAADGQLAYTAVYEFASPPDAAAYLLDGFEHLEARGARSYAVDVVAGAKGFSDAGEGEDGSQVSHGVAFVRGSRFFLVVWAGRTSAHTPADAADLALRVENGLNRGVADAENS